MNRQMWWKLLVVVGIVGIVLAAPTPVLAQATEAASPDEEANLTNALASVTAVVSSFIYAPFKAVVLCPFSALGAGATWLATGGKPSPATQVLHVGCEGDYFVTRGMIRGQEEFREPDPPSIHLQEVVRPYVLAGN